VNRYFLLRVMAATSFIAIGGTGVAAAAPPAWCKGANAESGDLRGLSSKDVRDVLKAFVSASCAPSAEADDHRGEIEAARQAWSKRLGLTEADWPDVVEYVAAHDDYSIPAEVKTKTLASASPLDQYALILHGLDVQGKMDTLYLTDMFETRLSEVGRYAFLSTTCFDQSKSVARGQGELLGSEVTWAICQADFERFDLARFQGELRADTTHDGALKMKLRVATYDLPRRIKEHLAEVQKVIAGDDGNKKLFEIVAAGRSEWTERVGKNAKLLDLVLAMESATIAQSRKQFEGCAETTSAALAEAASTLPAKSFAGFKDERMSPSTGFATAAGPVLAQSPAVLLAAIAYVHCTPSSGTAGFLESVLGHAPGVRGPRNAALARAKAAKITYDSMNAKLSFPRTRPYSDTYMDPQVPFRSDSAGGIVKSVKRNGDTLSVTLEKTTEKHYECIKEHSTGRVARIRDNGSVEYERVCDKSGTVTHDTTWQPFTLSAQYASLLKPGIVFSAAGKDVIAVWSNKNAKAPSWLLGGALR
jgi:hypothetical protein